MPDPELMAQATTMREQAALFQRKADVLLNTAETLEQTALAMDEETPAPRAPRRSPSPRRGAMVEPRNQRDDD